MTKLSFDYEPRSNSQTATYRDFTITATPQEYAECPWKEWDSCAPLLASNRDGVTSYGDYKTDLNDPLSYMSDGMLNRHWKRIASELEAKTSWGTTVELDDDVIDLLEQWDENPKRPSKGTLVQARREVLQNADLTGLDELETLWKIAGVPVYRTTSRGYSQSCWADLLIVLHEEFATACGFTMKQMKRRAEDEFHNAETLWSAWAWGDVYYYEITDPTGDEFDDNSCGGFYGADFDWSGLAGDAMSTIDAEINYMRKKRWARLKELIRARVPMTKRREILADFPAYA